MELLKEITESVSQAQDPGNHTTSSAPSARRNPVLRENPIRRSKPMDLDTRGGDPRLVSISRELQQTPIAPGKPLVPVSGQHSAKAPVPERGPTTTTQPGISSGEAMTAVSWKKRT
jgi:hypothetical protein